MDVGIIMFSGKNKKELTNELVDSVDLLIDGPFIELELDNDRILLVSKNKKLSFITNKYIDLETYFNNSKSLEEVTVEDYIFINGD